MTKKRELARHKSELEVRVRESFNTMSRYITMFRPCTDEAFELQDGSILEEIRRRGKLRKHQLMAWHRFWYILCSNHGYTDAMTVSYEERADTSPRAMLEHHWEFPTDEALKGAIKRSSPSVYLSPEAVEYQELWDFLRDEERGVLEQLIRDYRRAMGTREIHASTLPTLGMVLSGYQDNRQTIAAGVRTIQMLLNSIAQFYRYPVFYA